MSGIADCLQAHPEGICLQVKAVPRSSQNQTGETLGDRLKIRITAPPVDSAANEELIRFLAKTLGLPKSNVQLIRGKTSRNKTFLLKGSSVKAVVARLGESRVLPAGNKKPLVPRNMRPKNGTTVGPLPGGCIPE